MYGKLFWKLFFGNAVLIAAVLITCVWLITTEVDKFYQEDLTASLYSQAEMLRHLTADRFDQAHASELGRIAREIGQDDPAGLRITFVAASGTVLADSEAEPSSMEPHRDRAEIVQALREGWGEQTRLSHTLGRPMKYLAVRVGPAEAPLGVVRVAMPLRTIGRRSESARRLLWGTAALALLAALAFASGLARIWSAPIRRITRTARSLSRGDLSARVKVVGSDELANLARSLNDMRDHLARHLETIDGQRKTLQSLLAQLQEGVVVAGPDGRVVLMNPAAQRLLGLHPGAGQELPLEGAAIETCVAQHDLQNMLLGGHSNSGTTVHELRLPGPGQNGGMSLLATACDIVLPGVPNVGGAPSTGRLLVLTDVTPLARMLQVKADFAANASHELRTPLSAIRAAVETLLQMDLTKDAAAARQFLSIVERQGSRMEAMVADLLTLSRIETSPAQFAPSEVSLRDMLEELRARCADRLDAKGLSWTTDLPVGPAPLTVNPHLLRLVLENLLDNAIKFTDQGGSIRALSRCEHDQPGSPVCIEIADNGCGIPDDEQERVFERFYQVERARSGGPLRGTGLGLSIVRHAVTAMRGTVQLRSRLGIGTSVTISIPQEGFTSPSDVPATVTAEP